MMLKSGREMRCAGRVLAEVSELASAHRHTSYRSVTTLTFPLCRLGT